MPKAIDALPVAALDEQHVGLDLELRFTHCKDGKLDVGGSATGQTRPLAIGERGRAMVTGGAFTDGRWRPEDGIGIWSATDLADDGIVPTSAPHTWILDATRRRSTSAGDYAFSIMYEHRMTMAIDADATVSKGTFDVSLSEDDALTLDVLPVLGGLPGCPQTASIAVMPRLGAVGHVDDVRVLQYELWFVDEDADGAAKWTHATFGGLAGERVRYRLPAIRQPIEIAGEPRELLLGTDGGLRARWRDDGAVDLVVGAKLWHSLVEPGGPRSGGLGRVGKHAFRVEPGDVLRLELEVVGGAFTTKGADGIARETTVESLREGRRSALLVSVTEAQAHG